MGAQTPFVGEIHMFAGNFAPVGWAFCDGALIPITQNTALFSLLGTTYGGNGTSNFALPDLRGRAPLHNGQGPGLSSYSQGQTGGSENIALTAAQMPAHTHNLAASSAAGTSASPIGQTWAAGASGTKQYSTPANAGTTVPMNTAMLANSGSNTPHNNMQPSLAINYIIALQGIFPARP